MTHNKVSWPGRGRGSESLFCWNKDFAHRVTAENSLDVLIVDVLRIDAQRLLCGKKVLRASARERWRRKADELDAW